MATTRPVVVAGNTAFALDLYHRLRTTPGNLFFSPCSISTALAMTYAGARGETAQQMAQALHFTLPEVDLHLAFADLQVQLNAAQHSNNVHLLIANSLWPAQGLALRPEFLQQMTARYTTCITPLDYTRSETARQTINRWVREQTRDRIVDVIQPGMLHPSTALVLANAIYFKGEWAFPFKPEATKSMPFQVSATQTVQTPMMYQSRVGFSYAADEKVTLLELPYAGERLSMVILLPQRLSGLAELEEELTGQRLSRYLGRLRDLYNQRIDVYLPKFRITSEFVLNEALEALGMKQLFTVAADLSGMFDGRGPFVSSVVHKAFVEVNEQGTEAAAATGAMMILSRPPVFRADHPFLFLIRDRSTGSILFLGRVMNPNATGGAESRR